MKTLLITGGCGFIGSNFIHYVIAKYPEYRVVNLDKLTYAGNPANLIELAGGDRYRFVEGDICDPATVGPLVAEADIVVNFAAESHVDRSIMGGAEFVQTNFNGTYTLLDSAVKHGIERFHQISTDEVYGSINEGAWTEEWPLAPRNPYSSTKASAELLVRAYHITHGLPTVTTRASNNVGPFQYSNAIDDLPLPVYGDGSQVRDHLYVEDHCSAIDLVLHQGEIGEIYNVGGENDATGLEVAKVILKRLGKDESLLTFVTDRSGHDQRYALDSSKVQALGWQPASDFRVAMERTVDWYVENESWWREIKERQDYKDYYQRNYGNR